MNQIKNYFYLMRLHKPIGILLLLWPTLFALWLAGNGKPDWNIVVIFVLGTIVMRSAGCIINDIADRNYDGFVERTRNRPLACGHVSVKQALVLFFLLMFVAFLLVLMLNQFTILLAFIGAALALGYPYLKRITYFPQLGLGVAFAWGVPMAFAAELNQIPAKAWPVFLAAFIWPIIYDTYYAMVDRADDIKIGIKSTALLWGQYDLLLIGIFQIIFLSLLILVGWLFQLHIYYFIGVFCAALLFLYQQWITRDRNREACFKAFLNNNWVGLSLFLGVLVG